MQQNPFTISFGRVNSEIIGRDSSLLPIMDDFSSSSPRSTIYVITGPRGCGKTVSLSHLIDMYCEKKDWVVARISMCETMLEQMASILYEHGLTKFSFLKKEFSFSFHGISFSVEGKEKVSSVQAYLSKLLAYYKKKNIKVLVAVDDVAKTPAMVDFIRAYQGFLIDHYDVRLLFTGLYKNISKLENDRSLTFLYRAPKISLPPLSLHQIATSYQNVFALSIDESLSLSKLTGGYALAFQILGDILYRSGKRKIDAELLSDYDARLAEWSYEFIWSELTDQEKKVMTFIAHGKDGNQELMDELSISKGNLAIYKQKLAKEGLLDVSTRGKSRFILPRFGEYILFQEKLAEN